MKQKAAFFLLLLSLITNLSFAQLPKPDHIVVLILENHPLAQIINNPDAPYINTIINDPFTAFFNSSYALTHPSQPNYLMLYSGFNQGVTDNATPVNTPLTTPNLGASLIQNGYSFATYSEDLPYEGYLGDTNAYYVRKHNPCSNWQGTLPIALGTNGIPASCNKPFSDFPSNFDSLPTISFVVPNLINDMHNTYWLPSCVQDGDAWVQTNLDDYIQWCKTNNSLFILTFDEDDYSASNHITTFFTGAMVLHAAIQDSINHYSLLRTFEEMYSLPNSANTSLNDPILNCWTNLNSIKQSETDNFEITAAIVNNEITLNYNLNSETTVNIELLNSDGRIIFSKQQKLNAGSDQVIIKNINVTAGLYFLHLRSDRHSYTNKLFMTGQ